MDNSVAIEFMDQFRETTAALITMNAMIAANQGSLSQGKPPVYSNIDFRNLLKEHGLEYNARVEAHRRFY